MKYNRVLASAAVFIAVGYNAIGQVSPSSIIEEEATLVLVDDGFDFTEGPATDSLGNVFFTDQPNNRILKWSARDGKVTVFMENAGRANGLYMDRDGNLYACADEDSQLWKIDPEKNVTVLVDNYKGKRLNGPNDLWINPKGGIYLTDPFYQRPYWEHSEMEMDGQRVYYLPPGGQELIIVADGLVQPNGIIGTPDGKVLYIADIGDNKTYSFAIQKDGSLMDKKLFTDLGSDGMTLDNQGNVYLTGKGVSVFNKEGNKIEHIPVAQNWTANVTFGDTDRQTLFITAMNSIYSLKMKVKGVH